MKKVKIVSSKNVVIGKDQAELLSLFIKSLAKIKVNVIVEGFNINMSEK